MQGFKKLALVAAIAAVPAASFAMQPMNDGQMSGVTGQSGIVMTINTPAAGLSMGQTIYDRDGIGATTANGLLANAAGAIVIQNMVVVTGTGGIDVAIDAGASTATTPVLNVAVTIPTGTTINTGDLYVGTTTNTTVVPRVAADWVVGNMSPKIMNSSQITLGQVNMNIQLGNVAQSVGTWNPMIALNTTITGGVSINNFSLNDTSGAPVGGGTAGSLNIANMWIIDDNAGVAGTDLTVGGVGIDVTTTGLVIGVQSLGSATGINQYMTNVDLGNGTAIGDVAITGLQLSGTTITVSGH